MYTVYCFSTVEHISEIMESTHQLERLNSFSIYTLFRVCFPTLSETISAIVLPLYYSIVISLRNRTLSSYPDIVRRIRWLV